MGLRRHLGSTRRPTTPRASPYVIVLTHDERSILEARARRYTLPYRDVVRAKVVLLAAEGLENKEIGERLDMPRPVVSKWRKRFLRVYKYGIHLTPGLTEVSFTLRS